MELTFATSKLRSEALDPVVAERSYGPELAQALHARLADLYAAVRVTDLPRVSRGELGPERLQIRIDPCWRLVCEQVHPLGKPSLPWAKVHRLKVLRLEQGW
jgi:hypothetical protein